MRTARAKANEKKLVDFSVKAQDFIIKKGFDQYKRGSMDVQSAFDTPATVGIGSFGPQDAELNNFLDKDTDLPKEAAENPF